MPHELIDYSLTAAILSWLAKNGYQFFKGKPKGSGAATEAQVRSILQEHGAREEKVLESMLTEQRETNKQMVELVTIARIKWN